MDKIVLDKVVMTLIALIFLALFTALGNAVGVTIYSSSTASFLEIFVKGLAAMGILGAVSLLGFIIGQFPGFKKLPVILWVSLIAGYISSEYFPYHNEMIQITNQISMLAVCTPVLAYAGLSLGKDIESFKQISWKIIPVALAVFTGTFVFAALIAQVTLHWEGVIP